MRRAHRRSWVLATLILIGSLGTATTYREMTVDEMVTAAEIAFFGEVRDIVVFERDGEPWTRVVFDVEQNLLAFVPEEDAPDGGSAVDGSQPTELSFLGGRLVGRPALTVALMPAFDIGERVLVFAYQTDAASPIVGFRQGLWRAEGDVLIDAEGRVLGLDGDLVAREGPAAPVQSILEALAARFEERP